MPRKRRQIISNRAYELCIRAWDTLPLGSQFVTKLLIKSALARTQRDEKVELCHDISNGSHAHMIVVVKDALKCTQFVGELEKRLTDSHKRLLGLDHLNIWENRITIALIDDLPTAIERISYLYANPGQDNLVDRIEHFPGLSSWAEFRDNTSKLDAEVSERVPWIRMPSIPYVRDPKLTRSEDLALCRQLTDASKETHDLVRRPNAWMRCFNITDDAAVQKTNEKIMHRTREREAAARAQRKATGKPLLGAEVLRAQPLLKRRRPKKKDRKIYFLCSSLKRLKQLMGHLRDFCARCTECYRRWCMGDFSIDWPPGAFKPPIPPAYNMLEPTGLADWSTWN